MAEHAAIAAGLCGLLVCAGAAAAGARLVADHTTYHGSAARTGWYDAEVELTPQRVASARFGLLWESAPLDAAAGVPARLFASPLYVARIRIAREGRAEAREGPVVFAASTTGYVYAIDAARGVGRTPGAILWRRQLTDAPCMRGTYGILSTPVIDLRAQRLYVTACDSSRAWSTHAIDLETGLEVDGWPVALSAAAINAPGINANGANRFPDGVAGLQRGALNLSPDGGHVFVAFGGEPLSGWLVAVDTRRARVSSAYSITARTEEGVGGLWNSGGPAVDAQGNVYVATGSSVINALAGKGNAGVFPDSEGNWGQSIIRLAFTARGGFRLSGTYTPFNYCQAGGQDLDLGGGGPVLIDLPARASATPRLLALGGTKQGNVYLLDRERMPGGLVRRQPCGEDASRDGSLLAPQAQPQFGRRGPLNVFGPYSDRFGMGDLAKSRSTAAYFAAADGRHWLFVTGSAKAAEDSGVSIAPGLVRLAIVARRGEPAWLEIDRTQPEVVFQNPGSPAVSSRAGRDAIVWVLDVNKPRSASLYGDDAPKPVLYAFDALTLERLWRSEPGQLHAGGKYNEPVIADGVVYVGTDRIQAFGLQAAAAADAPADEAATLYERRCAMCHEQQRPDVPARAVIATRTSAAIVEKLAFGSMQPYALGLSDAQLEALARFLVPQRLQ